MHGPKRQYQFPKREEILSEMAGAQWFTKLDASHGFWQYRPMHLQHALSYQRLPFGISSAPDIFLCEMENVFEGLEESGFILMMS
jgi:hypothetical protein